MSSAKLYLAIPYARKDELKRLLHLKWDKDAKMWYVTSQTAYNNDAAKPFHIVNLNVLYDFKDVAKALGAQWNGHTWYVSRHLYNLYRDDFKRAQGGDCSGSDEMYDDM